MLMLIALEDDNLVVEFKDAVRPFKTTGSLLNHNVRGIPSELVLVQIAHQGVLLRETICLESSGITELAFVLRIEDHQKPTRDAGSFYEVLVSLFAMRFAVIRNEVLAIESGFATDHTLRTRAEEHPRQSMPSAARGFASWESIPRKNSTLIALCVLHVNHSRVFVPRAEASLPSRDIVIARARGTIRGFTGSSNDADHIRRGVFLTHLGSFSRKRIGGKDVTIIVLTDLRYEVLHLRLGMGLASRW
jgi:hypothetical protein